MTSRQMTYVLTAVSLLIPLGFAVAAVLLFVASDVVFGSVFAGFAVVIGVLAVRDVRRAWRRQREHEATLRQVAAAVAQARRGGGTQ